MVFDWHTPDPPTRSCTPMAPTQRNHTPDQEPQRVSYGLDEADQCLSALMDPPHFKNVLRSPVQRKKKTHQLSKSAPPTLRPASFNMAMFTAVAHNPVEAQASFDFESHDGTAADVAQLPTNTNSSVTTPFASWAAPAYTHSLRSSISSTWSTSSSLFRHSEEEEQLDAMSSTSSLGLSLEDVQVDPKCTDGSAFNAAAADFQLARRVSAPLLHQSQPPSSRGSSFNLTLCISTHGALEHLDSSQSPPLTCNPSVLAQALAGLPAHATVAHLKAHLVEALGVANLIASSEQDVQLYLYRTALLFDGVRLQDAIPTVLYGLGSHTSTANVFVNVVCPHEAS